MSGAVDLSALAAQAEASRAGVSAGGGAPAAPAGDNVVDVTDASFETEVIGRSARQVVVVDLSAAWSPESQQLSPVLAAMAQQSGGRWALARVDVDASPGIAQAFGVQSVPMVVAIAGGQPVSAFNGVQPQAQIQAWIDEILAKVGGALQGDPAGGEAPAEEDDPQMVAAEELMNSGDVDGALAAYRAIAEADPGNAEAASTVRNLEFILRAQGHDPSIVDNAAAGDIDAQLAAADVLLLAQQPEEAFERILAVVRTTAGDEKDKARTRLLELFELFEPSEPFVVAARRKLAAALY
ncbi:tetratricopeptide repeat protein [Gordonia caeni]